MAFNTPLRYPGGKGKLFNFMKKLIEVNKFSELHYAEPYAGGAGLAISLLLQEQAKEIYLNDINRSVYSFWHSALFNADELCSLIIETNVTMEEWHKQKEVSNKPLDHDLLTLGFSTFFLNRTNRSGILKGGVIGGKNQDGNWKLDARFNKTDLIDRIISISKLKHRIHISNCDAKVFIDDVVCNLPRSSMTYLDPPYYVKGKGLYENHYDHLEHELVAKKITEDIDTPWVVSYDNVPQIRKMYASCKKIVYGINYSAQDRYKGAEVMFFSRQLRVPKTEDPTKMK